MFLFDRGDMTGRLDAFGYQPALSKVDERVQEKDWLPLRHYIKSLAGGATPAKDDYSKYSTATQGGIPFLRVQNITDAGLALDDVIYIAPETHQIDLRRSQLHSGDLLITITGRLASAAVVPAGFTGNINQHSVVIRTDSAAVSEYLAAYINSNVGYKLALKRATGATRLALDYSALGSIPIVADLQIVEPLKQALAQKQRQEQAAQALLAGLDAYLLGELGIKLPPNEITDKVAFTKWQQLRGNRWDAFYHHVYFDAITAAVHSGRYKAEPLGVGMSGGYAKGFLPGDIEREGPYKIVQINSIGMDGRIDLSDLLTLSQPLLTQQRLRANDILVVLTGATIGKIGFWAINEPDFFLGGDLLKFQTNGQYDPYFVYAYLRTSPIQQEIKRNITGATNGHLSPYSVERLLLPSPPLAIQKELGEYARTTTAQAFAMQAQAQADFAAAKSEIERLILA